MNYNIITKIEWLGVEITQLPIGYTEDNELASAINEMYTSFDDWVQDNVSALEEGTITLDAYFDVNTEPYYSCKWSTDDMGGMNLPLVTDITQIEVV